MFISPACKSAHRAVHDTLDVLSGKWKLVILVMLQDRKMRFRELSRALQITPRVLAKELQELEQHQLITRTVCATRPVTVAYAATDHSRSLGEVLRTMRTWGELHHTTVIGHPRAGATGSESA